MRTQSVILHCAQVNYDYMRQPAGQLKGYERVTALYKSLALQSWACAQAWVEGNPRPPEHEPAIDAFWWALIPWSLAIGRDMGLDKKELGKIFVHPHYEFARYLRDASPEPVWPQTKLIPWRTTDNTEWKLHDGRFSTVAANVILYNDVVWTKMVIRLTARWGLLHHLKDIPALLQVRRLLKELMPPYTDNAVQRAYLASDTQFFRQLFQPFEFTQRTWDIIEQWITAAERACGIQASKPLRKN